MIKRPLCVIFLAFLFSFTAYGQQTTDPKPTYSLFNPVPKNEMREFSIDRPDITESPATVDAGHFQMEGELYKWTRFNPGKSFRSVNYLNNMYKIGLSDSWDFHVNVELYNVYQDTEGKTIEKGFGNTTLRLKHNFWGNDGNTKTALGVIPYVVLPTSPVDEYVAFGAGFPFSCSLTEKLGLGAQFQFDFVPDEKGEHQMGYLQTIVIGGPMVGKLDYFVEGMGIFSSGSEIYTLNGGLIFNPSDNMKIDSGVNYGLNDDSMTRVFLGLSFRI